MATADEPSPRAVVTSRAFERDAKRLRKHGKERERLRAVRRCSWHPRRFGVVGGNPLVPTLCVGMPSSTLRDSGATPGAAQVHALSGRGASAEHSHAERGNEENRGGKAVKSSGI